MTSKKCSNLFKIVQKPAFFARKQGCASAKKLNSVESSDVEGRSFLRTGTKAPRRAGTLLRHGGTKGEDGEGANVRVVIGARRGGQAVEPRRAGTGVTGNLRGQLCVLCVFSRATFFVRGAELELSGPGWGGSGKAERRKHSQLSSMTLRFARKAPQSASLRRTRRCARQVNRRQANR